MSGQGEGKDSKSAMTEALAGKDDGVFHSIKEGVKDACACVTGSGSGEDIQNKSRV